MAASTRLSSTNSWLRRSYLDTHDTFLETKTRQGTATTFKERIGYGWDDRAELTELGHEYAADRLDSIGLAPTCADDLAVALTSRYRRATLLSPEGERITVDTDLRWTLPDGTTLVVPEIVIVETKSESGNCSTDRALWRLGHRPTAISKYATGLAALRLSSRTIAGRACCVACFRLPTP